ncbi:MAG: fatty acid CoA ligase family protein [Desulfobacterales bacterium]|jgi:acyl-CoA synthetase (AMP-forming)/AMP-acid ligase II
MDDSGQKNKVFVNVSSYLARMAKTQPNRRAVVYPAGRDKNGSVVYTHLTYSQLDQESDRIAHGLQKSGITRGTRVILMVRPSLEFFALIFAILKIGAVYVVADPRMGLKRMVGCLKKTRPRAFIGISQAHLIRILYRNYFQTVKARITFGRRWFWGGSTLKQIQQLPPKPYEIAKTGRDDMAAILFTSGSTGPAKGAVYTHGNFDAQLQQIKLHLNMSSDEIDLSTFPLFALFYPALGITAVIPDMDPTRPARVNPARIIEAIENQGITNMFASPALLYRVGQYGKQKGIKLPSLKRVFAAGAPVSADSIQQFSFLLTGDAEIHTPYGATEAVPIISIKSNEILTETRYLTEKGHGICIGRPINNIDIRIIKISDDPIPKWSDALEVARGEVGEIAVKGALVSRQYFENPQMNRLSKIEEGKEFWHRMGDLGRMDKKGRIWYYGRKSHRVITAKETLFTIPCEAIFNNHPRVFRSALVGVGDVQRQKPVICIELNQTDDGKNKKRLEEELLDIASSNKITKRIETVLIHKSFPVDTRHNSKIFREKLSVWAERKLK